MVRTLRKYWQQTILAVYNLLVFGRLQAFTNEIPTTINNFINGENTLSLLRIFGITETSTLTNFITSVPWVWIISSLILTIIFTFMRKVAKVVIFAGIVIVGYLLIT
ncbi:MAG: hypothetical protein LBV67_12560 [Streptococcaceae bacterium]|nr:hypothetical protein [Streptococcaceae bacterium]